MHLQRVTLKKPVKICQQSPLFFEAVVYLHQFRNYHIKLDLVTAKDKLMKYVVLKDQHLSGYYL